MSSGANHRDNKTLVNVLLHLTKHIYVFIRPFLMSRGGEEHSHRKDKREAGYNRFWLILNSSLYQEEGLKLSHFSLLTCAPNTGILPVATVVRSNPIVRALVQRCLMSNTMDIIHPYGSTPRPKVSISESLFCLLITKLSADHRCISKIPIVIAYCTPLVVV